MINTPAYFGERPENMRFLRYLKRLLGEFVEFAWENKAWWIIPIVLVLLALTAFVFTTSSVAPFIYTLF